MTDTDNEVGTDERLGAPLADPASAVKLRGDPPRVMRLSRKAIGIASASAFALIGGALIYALQPPTHKGSDELYNTGSTAVADTLAGAPKDYGQVPKLGPALPGDLGKPILDAQRRGDVAGAPSSWNAAAQSCRKCGRSRTSTHLAGARGRAR